MAEIWEHYRGYAKARAKVQLQTLTQDLETIDTLYGRDALRYGATPEEVKAEALRQIEMDFRSEHVGHAKSSCQPIRQPIPNPKKEPHPAVAYLVSIVWVLIMGFFITAFIYYSIPADKPASAGNYDPDKRYVDAGFKLCEALRRTDQVGGRCEPNRADRTVNVGILTNDADRICEGEPNIYSRLTSAFAGSGWKLREDIGNIECLLD
jgi:hypothetical protein